MGGLGIGDPTINAVQSHETSLKSNEKLIDAIQTGNDLDTNVHYNHAMKVITEERLQKEEIQKEKSKNILKTLPSKNKRSIERSIEFKTSQWLTILPTSSDRI